MENKKSFLPTDKVKRSAFVVFEDKSGKKTYMSIVNGDNGWESMIYATRKHAVDGNEDGGGIEFCSLTPGKCTVAQLVSAALDQADGDVVTPNKETPYSVVSVDDDFDPDDLPNS
jgi:hypothetical protein